MSQSNQSITIRVHVHPHQQYETPSWPLEVHDGQSDECKVRELSIADKKEAKKFYQSQYLNKIVLRFNNYKGKAIREMEWDEAQNAMAEIEEALYALPVPPSTTVDSPEELFAVWLVPEDRALCNFSRNDVDKLYENFIWNVSVIGISIPENGDNGYVDELCMLADPIQKFHEHMGKKKKLQELDRMCGIQISIKDPLPPGKIEWNNQNES
ncbi:hypothetical protein M4D70_23120 [Brevibacillus borstelensis]|uniref:hypothetical protein n=1 Tax=Brevibacillus borstelensis TaxID=45462 RepID=UPI002041749D|nr:hypothetical protein [Brevibacillus borstelensis]MCM3625118.1 hypothetical protein [Brevibacillus borstelensis]